MLISTKETSDGAFVATASSKSTKEALGHKGERTWHAYAAPTISVDAQALAYDKPQDTSHAEYSQSIALTRDFAAPKPPRSVMGILPIPSQEILDMVITAHPKSRSEMIVRKARRLQHQDDVAKYTKNVQTAMVLDDGDSASAFEHTDSENIHVSLRPGPTAKFSQMLKYNVEQARVIEMLWTAEDPSLGECVEPLMALACPKPFRPLYPVPVLPPKKNGRCPYCHIDVRTLRHARLATHLLLCHSYTRQEQFCHQCAIFINSEALGDHRCPGVHENKQDYGVTSWRGLVISEGSCPYGTRGCREKLRYKRALANISNCI